jgi:hypothetical protein
MADVPVIISKTVRFRDGASPSNPVNTGDPLDPVNQPGTGGGGGFGGVGIKLNGQVIGGVKSLIEENEILDIPSFWEYNIFFLDIDGRIDIDANGSINILNSGFVIDTQNYISTAIDYMPTNKDSIIEVTGIGVVITLPSSVVSETGYTYKIDNSSGGDITVISESGETIQGETTQVIPNNSCMNIFANGTSWRIS